MKKKKGISLIVLIITIIVMIILAATAILTLSNSGIINRANEAVEKTDLAQVKNLAALKWSEAYLRNEKDIETYVLNGLKNERINIDKYDITVTLNGVDVELKEEVPSEWNENVVALKDGVPVPKGFVASPYSGEKTKEGGLVIYELAEGETSIPSNETQYTSWTTRNQYVWVPVEGEDFTTKFIRQNFNSYSEISNKLGDYSDDSFMAWEVVIDSATNMPELEQSLDYITSTTLAEIQAMYASVKKYGGFYIARYEAGIDNQRTSNNGVLETNIYSMMGKIPYTYVPWTKNNLINEDTNGAVQVARSIYPASNTEYGVVSTLTYGVQWDTVLQWWLDTKTVTDVLDSKAYGNCINHEINVLEDLNIGAKVAAVTVIDGDDGDIVGTYLEPSVVKKPSGTIWMLSTGALKAAKLNNIYDMAGNFLELTMEGCGNDTRIIRGGDGTLFGDEDGGSVADRLPVYVFESYYYMSFRVCLYIK